MKIKILFFISSMFLLGCQTNNANIEKQELHLPEANRSVLKSDTPGIHPAYPLGENEEYLDWSSLRINGKSPLTASVKDVEGILGRADSVVNINWMETCSSRYRNENSRNAYFGGAEFEQFGDSLDFMHVDFSRDRSVFLQHNKLRLNHKTTLEEVEKHFPKAVRNISKGYYLLNGKATDSVNLPPSKELSGAQWNLMFQDGKLIGLDLWFPC